MARRTSFNKGFAGLVTGSIGAVSCPCAYNVDIRITHLKRAAGLLVLVLVVFVLGYLISLTVRIGRQSKRDEARPADVIIVMGAAEYRGHPSPVLKLRLDHAVSLYQKRLAPFIMTTGGPGGDPSFTEGGVGRSYLIDRGVPAESVIVEEAGESTAWSLSAASEILRRMGLHSCIIVSAGDGGHHNTEGVVAIFPAGNRLRPLADRRTGVTPEVIRFPLILFIAPSCSP
jgi:vancomycin permeability regulator SanA